MVEATTTAVDGKFETRQCEIGQPRYAIAEGSGSDKATYWHGLFASARHSMR
eukprot:CAMPEP_0184678204 /NCGR_PEP_ID=MMETSP0312-20130426/912_1 /TAXON_ID=31354 /ORGANISM="Compsopogon coeruleus, Strain SAG 36.94" /LENGTH=51 /DNA_ID=CAMNT_0027126737 /DNA_START=128 /DNA_END=279 /DNA_ORIENTATION=-